MDSMIDSSIATNEQKKNRDILSTFSSLLFVKNRGYIQRELKITQLKKEQFIYKSLRWSGVYTVLRNYENRVDRTKYIIFLSRAHLRFTLKAGGESQLSKRGCRSTINIAR